MTERTLQGLIWLRDNTPDAFERDLFGAILAMDAAARAVYEPVADETAPPPHIFLTDERQREICLRCQLPECVGLANPACPIRIEQRAEWRRRDHRKSS